MFRVVSSGLPGHGLDLEQRRRARVGGGCEGVGRRGAGTVVGVVGGGRGDELHQHARACRAAARRSASAGRVSPTWSPSMTAPLGGLHDLRGRLDRPADERGGEVRGRGEHRVVLDRQRARDGEHLPVGRPVLGRWPGRRWPARRPAAPARRPASRTPWRRCRPAGPAGSPTLAARRRGWALSMPIRTTGALLDDRRRRPRRAARPARGRAGAGTAGWSRPARAAAAPATRSAASAVLARQLDRGVVRPGLRHAGEGPAVGERRRRGRPGRPRPRSPGAPPGPSRGRAAGTARRPGPRSTPRRRPGSGPSSPGRRRARPRPGRPVRGAWAREPAARWPGSRPAPGPATMRPARRGSADGLDGSWNGSSASAHPASPTRTASTAFRTGRPDVGLRAWDYAARPGRMISQLLVGLASWCGPWCGRWSASSYGGGRGARRPGAGDRADRTRLAGQLGDAATEAAQVPGVGRPAPPAVRRGVRQPGRPRRHGRPPGGDHRAAGHADGLARLPDPGDDRAARVWLPRRIRFVRRARPRSASSTRSADLDLFALRAMANQPMHVLAAISDDPVRAWRRATGG